MPNHTDGMILIGDAAGLESTELCDGVPAAWFSADIAADVAIEALRAGDTSREFLARYDERIRDHPIIQWSITASNRFNLRFAQEHHDLEEFKKYVHDGWGLGGFCSVSTPLVQSITRALAEDPTIITAWIRMFFRYYFNWIYERYDYSGGKTAPEGDAASQPRVAQTVFRGALGAADTVLRAFSPALKGAASLAEPLSRFANPAMQAALPLLEAVVRGMVKMERFTGPVSDKIVDFVRRADPATFDPPRRKGI